MSPFIPTIYRPHLAVPRTWEMRPNFHRLSYGLGVSEETEIVVSYDMFKAEYERALGGRRILASGSHAVHGGSPMCL